MAELPSERQFGDYGDWPGREVRDPGGERLGAVREIYLDRETHQPEWVLVAIDDGEERFVPLADAAIEDGAIRVAHGRDAVTAAPGIGTAERIDPEDERRLYEHYGVPVSQDESSTVLPDPNAPAAEPDTAAVAEPEQPVAAPEPETAAAEPETAPAGEPELETTPAAEPKPETATSAEAEPPAGAPEVAPAPPPMPPAPEPSPASRELPPPPAPPRLPPPVAEPPREGVVGTLREKPAIPIVALIAAALALLVLGRKLRG